MSSYFSSTQNAVENAIYKGRKIGRTIVSAYKNNNLIEFDYQAKNGKVIRNVIARVIRFESSDDEVNPVIVFGVTSHGNGHPGYRPISVSNITRARKAISKQAHSSGSSSSSTSKKSRRNRKKTLTL